MLTGRRAFAGDDVSDTLASVLKSDVDYSGVPRSVRGLLTKCLEKDPKRGLHDIGDAWDLIDDGAQAPPRPTSARFQIRRRRTTTSTSTCRSPLMDAASRSPPPSLATASICGCAISNRSRRGACPEWKARLVRSGRPTVGISGLPTAAS